MALSPWGCPGWSGPRILGRGDGLGYAALGVRGIAGEMDLPKVPELAGPRLAETRRQLGGRGLVVSDLGASAHMHEKDPAAREKQEGEGRRFIDLAQAMGVKYVRMFGNEVPKGETREEVLPRVIEGFPKMSTYAKAAGVVVLIESHGDFMNSRDLTEILTGVNDDSFALLWDAHHTFVAGHEAPADTYARLGRWARHTHPKDSRPAGDAAKPEERRYVLTRTGEAPVDKQAPVLAQGGYKGYHCHGGGKKWEPETEEPEVGFSHYAKTMAGYLDAAGVKPA